MWVATIDFMKPFDSITHKSIWDALESCGIEHGYINLLKELCKDQKANAMTAEESDLFQIKKENKQGDPLSSLFFNCFAKGSEGRAPCLAKEERNWYLPW